MTLSPSQLERVRSYAKELTPDGRLKRPWLHPTSPHAKDAARIAEETFSKTGSLDDALSAAEQRFGRPHRESLTAQQRHIAHGQFLEIAAREMPKATRVEQLTRAEELHADSLAKHQQGG